MRLVFKKENLAVNVFVVTLLLLIFQVGKFFAAQNYQMFFDILLSFLLGIFLFSLTVLLFGHFKKKLVFMTGLVA
ncbi:MAG: hypothetical protein KJ574_03895, partial [Nanoarchaeota archaeon]|nr:hypothetical protein [Nanoarchaeota archaeon]